MTEFNFDSVPQNLQAQIENRQVVNQLRCRVHVQLYFDVLQSLSIFVTGLLYSVNGFLYYAPTIHFLALFGMLLAHMRQWNTALCTVALIGLTLGVDLWSLTASIFSLYSCLHDERDYANAHVLYASNPCGAHNLDSGIVFAFVAAMTAYGMLGSVTQIQNVLSLNTAATFSRKTYYAVASYSVLSTIVLLRVVQHGAMLFGTDSFVIALYIGLWSVALEILFCGYITVVYVLIEPINHQYKLGRTMAAAVQYMSFIMDIYNASAGIATLRAPTHVDADHNQALTRYFGRENLPERYVGELVVFVALALGSTLPHFVLASSYLDAGMAISAINVRSDHVETREFPEMNTGQLMPSLTNMKSPARATMSARQRNVIRV